MKLSIRKTAPVVAEYNRLRRALRTDRHEPGFDRAAVYGAMQALAWALRDDAMAPTCAFVPKRNSSPDRRRS